MLTIAALGWARRHKRDFDAVITIEDPDFRRGLRFHRTPRPAHLILRFIDVDHPLPSPYDDIPVLRMARPEHLILALEFARRYQDHPVLVHCHAGISRSTALGLAIIADRLGPGRETQALEALLRLRPHAVPNLHVVAVADDLLGRQGRLMAVVNAWEADRPDNRWRRRAQRQVQFLCYGVPKTAEPELFE